MAEKYPYKTEEQRLSNYAVYDLLLKGEHYSAFAIRAEKGFTERYALLRYLTCNFAGLVCKVMADFLFGEEIKIKCENNQDWIQAFYEGNSMRTLNFETAISNTALGDAIYKIRVENKEIIVESVKPSMYTADLTTLGRGGKPKREELAWKEKVGEKEYLIRETYTPGFVSITINELEKNGDIGAPVEVTDYNTMAGTVYVAQTETKIKKNLLVHVPNYRTSGSYYGLSDFIDIQPLLFGLNNRMTKIDNILDKHSDPILAVPPGVMDEEGHVRMEAFKMIEMPEDGKAPEFIVWNASLESAFSEIDKIVEFLFMFSETSPDVLGLSKGGQAESGRALKMRLIRTLAKRNRKRIYYDQALREIFMIAQELSNANGFTVDGVKCPKPAEKVDVLWDDGLLNDPLEEAKLETLKLENGLISKKRAIMKLEGVTEELAEQIIEEVGDEMPEPTPIVALPRVTNEQ